MSKEISPAVIEGEIVEELTVEERQGIQPSVDKYNKGEEHIKLGYYMKGTALREIQSKLAHAGNGTFVQFCESEWDLSTARVYQLIEGANVVDKMSLSTIVERLDDPLLPASESQARALTRLGKDAPAEELREIMKGAVAAAPKGKPSAKDIAKRVTEKLRSKKPEKKKIEAPRYNRTIQTTGAIKATRISFWDMDLIGEVVMSMVEADDGHSTDMEVDELARQIDCLIETLIEVRKVLNIEDMYEVRSLNTILARSARKTEANRPS